MQMNDVVVDSFPKSMSENPTDNTHTLMFRNHDDFTIQMGLRGIISFSFQEADNSRIQIAGMHLTAESPDWDPHSRCLTQMI
jgi:hypothetical protein